MITLKVSNVIKRFGEFTAVNNISFEIKSGRIFGFLGPNGAGKTTTIRMIVGITAPDEGAIELFGQKITPEIQDKIGYLPEERGLYKKMKVNEQLRYFAALKGIAQKEADKRIDFWLEKLKLSDWKLKKSSDLSKGMSQKIQFIATVLHEPELIILDEPFSGLDPVNAEVLIETIAELKANGKTIIFSTHLMETAERLCDDIILINKSKKIIGGTLREVKESFSKNLIALRCIGGEKVLEDKDLVKNIVKHSDELEIELAQNTDSQILLKKLIENNAVVTKFEKIEPSLNDIFIEKVKEKVKE
ncbi:MAG: ATP-binding cassette domain-containing protein [Pyrinomonadaceae bacterium]|jgi:ABC-2 type transport system ATP-binding protein|nr:ATP-binding cassette domain-containing protein [Pyrinomonadaceae bacterium]